jgi:hypothetical protein
MRIINPDTFPLTKSLTGNVDAGGFPAKVLEQIGVRQYRAKQ